MKKYSRFLFATLVATMSLALTACGDDDEPDPRPSRLTNFTEMAGAWTTETGDWVAVVAKNQPSLFDMNRMSVMWDGRLYDLGVPRLYAEDGVYKLSGLTATPWEIRRYSPQGMVLYNPATRTEKEFVFKGDANLAIVKNALTDSWPFIVIAVYSNDELVYRLELESGLGYGAKSVPFYMPGDEVAVHCYNHDGSIDDTAVFDNLEPDKFYKLDL